MQLASFLVIAFWKIYSTSFRNGNLFMLIKNLAFRIKRSRMFSIHRCDICAKRSASRTMYREDSAVDSFHLMQALLHKRKANISRLTVSIRKHFCLRVRLEADFYLKSWKKCKSLLSTCVHWHSFTRALLRNSLCSRRPPQACASSRMFHIEQMSSKDTTGSWQNGGPRNWHWLILFESCEEKKNTDTHSHTHTYIIIAGKSSEMRREAFASNHPNIVRNCLSRCSL